MATATLTVGSGTQQWTPPADCLVIDLVEIWGPGGSGGKRAGRVTGGGSGAYVAIPGPIDVSSIKTSGTVPYQTGRGGAAQATASTAGNPGTAKSWFYSSTVFTADLGGGGQTGTSGTVVGGIAGAIANCIPSTWAAKVGGAAGTCSSASGASGGGASGSSAGNGVDSAAVSTAVAGAGATAPAGGGNGGGATITTTTATSGTSPGGGGGGHNNATNNSGAGADGAIVVTYTPYMTISQAWNPAHAGPSAALSNSNLTMTGGANYAVAYGTISKTAGKFYWEVVVTRVGNETTINGVGNIASATTVSSQQGQGATFGWLDDGLVYQQGAQVATWAVVTTGSRICLALDLDNKKIWGRLGTGGNWNNDVIANQDPANNIGGVTLDATIYASAVVPGCSAWDATDNLVASFAFASWSGIAPSGFGSFNTPQNPFRQQAQMLPIMAQ